ncbi:MAG: NAD-dependent epimerase/dehydratase family protein [Flammeovirgaceae bacterium]|nr:NAD-dependent epimerase/dehydratase family protein [Flammeovirgaceae bacterium]
MKVSLITGGAGFIGAHVSREALKLGHKVIILDDLSGGFEENIPEGVIFIKGSITDSKLIGELFQNHSIDYVYHLAAYAAEGLSHFIRRFNYENNLIGSINLINESIRHKVKCFVFTSSIAVYGKGQLPMHEDMTPLPEDPYGVSKLAVEQDLKCAHEMFGLNYIIFRPHNVYGEYQNLGDKYRNVVGIFMNQLMQNKPLTIFGDGMQSRAFSYVGDIAPVIANSVNMPDAQNQIFNIGADVQFTVKDLATEVCKAMGKEGQIRYLDARNEVAHAYSSHEKATRVFNTTHSTSLHDGLNKMAAWALQTGSKKSSSFSNIEITEKLPPVWLE